MNEVITISFELFGLTLRALPTLKPSALSILTNPIPLRFVTETDCVSTTGAESFCVDETIPVALTLPDVSISSSKTDLPKTFTSFCPIVILLFEPDELMSIVPPTIFTLRAAVPIPKSPILIFSRVESEMSRFDEILNFKSFSSLFIVLCSIPSDTKPTPPFTIQSVLVGVEIKSPSSYLGRIRCSNEGCIKRESSRASN